MKPHCVRSILGVLVSGALVSAAPQTSRAPVGPAFLLATPTSPKTVRGRYLDATPSSSVPAVSPGTPFTLVLEVAPKAGMHVYAPGNKDYKPIAWSIAAQPGVKVGSTTYPKGTTYVFGPAKEHVMVYSTPIRLERVLTIAPASKLASPATGSILTLKGTLEYQACDDKVCYLPQELPLTWPVVIQR